MALKIEVGPDFNFRGTVESHGWPGLLPFTWDGEAGRLERVERLAPGRVVHLTISKKAGGGKAGGGAAGAAEASERGARARGAGPGCLVIETGGERLSPAESAAVKARVRRMLRLDEDFSEFWAACRRQGREDVARRHLGRMIRSTSVFEDVVKVMLTVNTTWKRTKTMVAGLVEALGEPVAAVAGGGRAFPTPEAVAAAGEEFLRLELRYGYRSKSLAQLAQRVVAGDVDLEGLLDPRLDDAAVRRRLLDIRGVGPYAAATTMALLGYYSHLAFDSEMIQLVWKKIGKVKVTPADADKLYEQWGRWRYLGYLAEAYGW